MKPTRQSTNREFNQAAEDLQYGVRSLPCYDRPEEFTEYEKELRPLPQGAEAMCAGCPLIEQCLAYAWAHKKDMDGQVRGGFAWVNGAPEVGMLAA